MCSSSVIKSIAFFDYSRIQSKVPAKACKSKFQIFRGILLEVQAIILIADVQVSRWKLGTQSINSAREMFLKFSSNLGEALETIDGLQFKSNCQVSKSMLFSYDIQSTSSTHVTSFNEFLTSEHALTFCNYKIDQNQYILGRPPQRKSGSLCPPRFIS